jgi:hypothetical protein
MAIKPPVAPDAYADPGDRPPKPAPWNDDRPESTRPLIAPARWRALGRHEKRLIYFCLQAFRVAKGALVETSASVMVRLPRKRDRTELRELLETQRHHYRRFAGWCELFEAGPLNRPTPEELIGDILAELVPPTGRDEWSADTPSAQLALVLSATESLGLLFQTGYRGMLAFFERNQLDERNERALDTMRRDDRELVRRTRQFGSAGDGLIRERVRRGVEHTLVPTMTFIREMQTRFDFPALGIVPDEFVAVALRHFFDVLEFYGSTGPSLSANRQFLWSDGR